MGVYESQWEDRFGVKYKVIIPFSEIIAWRIVYYPSMNDNTYTPVVRKDFDYRSKIGKDGELDYLKWIDYIKNK